ncbi:MAG: right-handed parallel beta-helix repeat-containing protein [Burkholderiales bacterium]|nr:right-handed parallel beta-helix repeat-containing protein [Burkholderiales bacterium]
MDARAIAKVARAAALAAALLPCSAAHAQLFRAYLSSAGSDANPCTLPAPCRLLPAALAAVASGGEVWLVDSANYNTATVDVAKSVTILAVPGVVGSVVSSGGPAISVATPGVRVVLRNLAIVPLQGAGATGGISMTAGDSLTVEDSLVSGLPGDGISVDTAAAVRIVDTTVRGNAGSGIRLAAGARATITRATVSGQGLYGIVVQGTAGAATAAAIADSTLEANYAAVFAWSADATGAVEVSVRDSQLAGNTFGAYALSTGGAAVTLVAADNAITLTPQEAIAADGTGARVWARGNIVTGNGTGLAALAGGLFESAGDNAVRDNGADKNGTIAVVELE